MSGEEIVIPHVAPKERVPLATSVRGTVIVASLRGIRRLGHGERYLSVLDPRFHDRVASLTAATWLPLDFADAHYCACDRLALERWAMEDIGAESGRFINETVLSVVAKLSKESGVTPWFALGHVNKLLTRTWIGSSFAVLKTGPKEARLEWIQQPLAKYPYFRVAFGAFAHAICKLFASTLYVREIPRRRGQENEVSYRISWA